MGFVRWALALGVMLCCAVPGFAQEFEARMSGIYTAGDDFDFPVQMVIWPDPQGEGFGGSVTISGARYPLYAERDGAALRGIFEAEGAVQRFAFLPPEGGVAQVEFTGEAAPVAMTRAGLPSFRARYEGDFGSLSLRLRDGAVQAVLTDSSGAQDTWQGRRFGLRVLFEEAAANVVYEPGNDAYYLEMPGFFGAVEALPLPIVVGQSEAADVASLEAALAEVEAGGRIELEPGRYAGEWSVDVPVQIVGQGGRDGVVLEPAFGGLYWSAPEGELVGLSVKPSGTSVGLRMSAGQMEARDVVIEAEAGPGIALSGPVRLGLTDVVIKGGAHAIEALDFEGVLVVHESVLEGAEKSLLSLAGGAFPGRIEMLGTSLHGSPSNAVRLTGGVSAVLAQNEISDVRAGVHVSDGATVLLNENAFVQIGTHALWLDGALRGGDVALRNNSFADIGEACILFYNLQTGDLVPEVTGNEVRGCDKFGLAVIGDETQVGAGGIALAGNMFAENATHLVMSGGARVQIDGGEMVQASGPAVALSGQSVLQMQGVVVAGAGDHGVVAIGPDVQLRMEASEINGAKKSGLVLSEGAKADMRDMRIVANGLHGVEMHQGSAFTGFSDNVVEQNGGAGVMVSGGFFVPEEGNVFEGNAQGDVVRR